MSEVSVGDSVALMSMSYEPTPRVCGEDTVEDRKTA